MKHVPNILSFLRLALCPVFIWLFFTCSPQVSFLIFASASLLDVADGFIARRFNAVTMLGKIIDPLADKILQLSAVICFSLKNTIPWFIIIILGAKELAVLIGGGIISSRRKNMVYSNMFGKLASFMTSFSLCALFFVNGFLSPASLIIYIILYFSVLLSIISMVQYGIIALFSKEAH